MQISVFSSGQYRILHTWNDDPRVFPNVKKKKDSLRLTFNYYDTDKVIFYANWLPSNLSNLSIKRYQSSVEKLLSDYCSNYTLNNATKVRMTTGFETYPSRHINLIIIYNIINCTKSITNTNALTSRWMVKYKLQRKLNLLYIIHTMNSETI